MTRLWRALCVALICVLPACEDSAGKFVDAIEQREQGVETIAFVSHTARLPSGAGQTLSLLATDFDGVTSAFTGVATWSSSNTGVATVVNGLVDGVTAGSAVITATVGSISVDTTLTVYDTTLIALSFDPSTLNVHECGTGAVTVNASFQDGSRFLLVPPFNFNAPANVGVTDGTTNVSAYANASGSYTVPLTESGVTQSFTLVASDTLSSIALDSTSVTLAVNATKQFTATATFSDSTTADITQLGTWSLVNGSPSNVLTVSTSTLGEIEGGVAGSGTVRFECGGVQADASVIVDPASVLQRIEIGDSAGEIDLATGATTSLVLTAYYADGSEVIVTEQADWAVTLGDTATVSVSDTAGTKGQVTAAAGVVTETSAIVEAEFDSINTLVRVFVARN